MVLAYSGQCCCSHAAHPCGIFPQRRPDPRAEIEKPVPGRGWPCPCANRVLSPKPLPHGAKRYAKLFLIAVLTDEKLSEGALAACLECSLRGGRGVRRNYLMLQVSVNLKVNQYRLHSQVPNYKMVKVAIAGGTGDVGRTILEVIKDNPSHEVIVLTRKVRLPGPWDRHGC